MPRRLVALLALLLIAHGTALSAQVIRGRVVDAATRAPINGALIELRDTSGRSLRIVLTGPTGTFQIAAPVPDRYLLRAAAIGFTPQPPGSVTVSAEGITVPDIGLRRMVMRLPDLVSRVYCGQTAVTDATFGRLLQSAHDALRIIQQTISSQRLGFTQAIVHTNIYYGLYNNFTVADTMVQMLATWPVRSINTDTLRLVGFSRLLRPKDEASREYFGPDPGVLFSDWFLNTHCFKLARLRKDSDTLHVTFVPQKKSKLVDVSGELVLDAASLSLHEYSFTLLNLPSFMPDFASGGEMQFAQHESGAWMATNWAIWGPIVPPTAGSYRVGGLREIRGVVVRVVNRDTAVVKMR